MLDVVLDLLRHFFFLESTVLANRRSQRLPWQAIAQVLQWAFPVSGLANLSLVAATKAVTERKRSVLRSLDCAGLEGAERQRLAVFFPPQEFMRVPANECVTDAMLAAFLQILLAEKEAPENRPEVVRSPITSPTAARSPITPHRQRYILQTSKLATLDFRERRYRVYGTEYIYSAVHMSSKKIELLS